MWLVLPAQAANRNDFLYNLRDTFNSPASERFGLNAILGSLVILGLLVLFFYAFSSQQNVRRASRKLKRAKRRQLKKASQRTNGLPQQQRNWYRLATRAEFRWIPAEQALKVRTNRYKVDHLLDISGGGISFTTTENLKPEDRIRILLYPGSSEPMFLDGKVIRVVSGDGTHKVSVEFLGIRDGQRDKIIAWIMSRQRLTIHGEKPEKTRLGQDE